MLLYCQCNLILVRQVNIGSLTISISCAIHSNVRVDEQEIYGLSKATFNSQTAQQKGVKMLNIISAEQHFGATFQVGPV